MRSTTNTSTERIGDANLPILVDTSAHYALADADDANHEEAADFFHRLEKEERKLITTNFIVAESYGLMLLRLGRAVAFNYIATLLSGEMHIERVTLEDEKRAWEILTQYDDQDFSYVDATSFALMERLGILDAFAFDKHFDVFKTKRGQRLTRLPHKRLK